MMQPSEIISVNIWQMLISMCNLLLLFLILKKFLYGPVKKAMNKRREELDSQYAAAEEAEQHARENQAEWEQKRQNAQKQAEELIKAAAVSADRRGEEILEEARQKADSIVQQAENEAVLTHKKAAAGIRQEIVDISAQLTGKLLDREIRPEDHRELIDSFLEELGEHDGND